MKQVSLDTYNFSTQRTFALAILCVLLFVFAFPIGVLARESSPTQEEVRAGMVTENYKVTAYVNHDNSIRITESIGVNFLESSRGIMRNIPVSGKVIYYDGDDRVEMDARMKVEDVTVTGGPFTTYKENGELVIRVGDPDVYLDGPMQYEISYTARMYDDGIKDYDIVYLNMLPTGWASPIRQATLTVSLPGADTDVSAAEFISGQYGYAQAGEYDVVTQADKTSDRVVLTATSKAPLTKGSGATFLLRVPEGYFTGEVSDTLLFVVMAILLILVPLICLILWFSEGRDKPLVKPVEFYPPDGLSSGDIGYLVDGRVEQRDLLSMFLWWASKGILSITETSKGKFTIRKLGNLPANAKSFERVLWNSFGSELELGKPSAGLASALTSAKKALVDDYKQDVRRMLYTKRSVVAGRVCFALATCPIFVLFICLTLAGSPVSIGGVSGAGALASSLAQILGPGAFFAVWIFVIGGRILLRVGVSGGGIGARGGVILLLIFIVLVCVIGGAIQGYPLAGLGAAASGVIAIVLGVIARKRTDYYNGILGRIFGFKNFIDTAEVNRMERLFEQDPGYYYGILPFAWVFGLSDLWARKFERMAIAPPTWYYGYYEGNSFNTYWMMRSLGRMHTATIRSFTPPASSGGGGSGGGGGFSSGGSSFGGGFSGGGFGGGGGGRW
ncbi:hypothetical protein AGMMS49983_04660 [Clostridia bacterium]|nr:hypothetical protein AGMMS49983_04660 [Clostridia bacterium]